VLARLAFLVVLPLVSLSCGKKGDPLPPLRHVPARVEKLAIAERGGFIHLEWEAPRKTNHGSPKVELKEAEILRRVLERLPVKAELPEGEQEPEETAENKAEPQEREEFVGPPLPPPPPPPPFQEQAVVIATLEVPTDGGPVSFRDPWDPTWEGKRVEYAVQHLNRRGAASEASPVVAIDPVPPLTAPGGLEAAAADGFVLVTWREEPRGLFGFDLLRRSESGTYLTSPLNPAPLGVARYEDRTAPWGVPICYQVKKVAVLPPPEAAATADPPSETELVRSPAAIESPESAEACVTAIDAFAPPQPGNPVAVAATGGILISWKEVPVADLGGYLVYRATSAEGPFELQTEKPLSVATYTDRRVESGQVYFYAVSALDRTVPPNESARSQLVSARASE